MSLQLRAAWTRIGRALKSARAKEPKIDREIVKLRESLAAGLSPDLASQICDALSKATGVTFICVWDTYTAAGFQLNPALFGLDGGGRLYWMPDEVAHWLSCTPTMTENAVPATPETLRLVPSDMHTAAFDYFDGHHNYAVYAPAMHDPASLRPVRTLSLSDLA